MKLREDSKPSDKRHERGGGRRRRKRGMMGEKKGLKRDGWRGDQKERSDCGVNEQETVSSRASFTLSRRRQSDKGSSGSHPPCRVGLKDPF